MKTQHNLTLATTALLCVGAVDAAVTYVDADVSTNTTFADGSPLSNGTGYADPNNDGDDLWGLRGFGNGSSILQGGIGENAPRLRTTISTGLTVGETYEVFAYFWGAGGSGSDGLWRGRASLTNDAGDLQGYNTVHFSGSSFIPMTAVTSVSRPDALNLDTLSTADGGGIENGGYFSNTVTTEESDRRLYQLNLGTVVVGGSGSIDIFIDDLADTAQGNRTWYDGVGFELTTPFDPDVDDDGLLDSDEQHIIDADPNDDVTDLTDVAGPNDLPTTTDFDADGSSDAEEILVTLTDPTDPDSDDDGLLDGVETNTGSFTGAGDTGTDPLDPDHDLDGYADGTEVIFTSDPTSAASLPGSMVSMINPGFEAPVVTAPGEGVSVSAGSVPGWQALTNDMWVTDAVIADSVNPDAPTEGSQFLTADRRAPDPDRDAGSFDGGNAATLTLLQDVDVSAFATDIDAGARSLLLNFDWFDADPADRGKVTILFLDGSGVDFPGYSTFLTSGNPADWRTQSLAVHPPALTRTVRIILSVENLDDDGAVGGGTVRNVHFDNFSARIAFADADNDQMADDWELTNGLDPTIDDSSGDLDTDTLTNLEEFLAGTHPGLTDTDGDYTPDDQELSKGTDPLDPSDPEFFPGESIGIASNGAWTWFNDERAIWHLGKLYSGYVLSDGRYGITRYDPASNTSSESIISTGSSQEQDDHNNPSITILPDNRLLIIYSKHITDDNFYHRTSLVTEPATLADWGPEIEVDTSPGVNGANNTYANTYRLSGESDLIYYFHRNINFNPTVTLSSDNGATWGASTHFIDTGGGGTRPYPRYSSNHVDRIDLIYTDGHPRDVNNSIYHMYYHDGAFHETDGNQIDTISNLPLDHDAGERGSVVYAYSAAPWGPEDGPDDWIPNGRAWTWDIHYGTDGHPVCVFQVQVDNITGSGWNHDRIYYYYARWTGSEWQRRFIGHGGRGIYSGEDDYGGGMSIDPDNPNVVYISSNAANPFDLGDINNVPLGTNERYEIYRGDTSDGGLTFEWEAITSNSPKDNLRPIVPEGHGYGRHALWFFGDYNTYTNFDTKVVGLFSNALTMLDTQWGATGATLTWASSPGMTYDITGSIDLVSFGIDALTNIPSQGAVTSQFFEYPVETINEGSGFFRVEEQP